MKRIQRTRKKGDKLPPNTLVITRGTKWGNPYKVSKRYGYWCVFDNNQWYEQVSEKSAIYVSVKTFDYKLTLGLKNEFIEHCLKNSIENIACFCPTDSPCHGDVWLEVWEEYQKQIGNSNGN